MWSSNHLVGRHKIIQYSSLLSDNCKGSGAMLVMEHLDMSGILDHGRLGEGLARLHLHNRSLPEVSVVISGWKVYGTRRDIAMFVKCSFDTLSVKKIFELRSLKNHLTCWLLFFINIMSPIHIFFIKDLNFSKHLDLWRSLMYQLKDEKSLSFLKLLCLEAPHESL